MDVLPATQINKTNQAGNAALFIQTLQDDKRTHKVLRIAAQRRALAKRLPNLTRQHRAVLSCDRNCRNFSCFFLSGQKILPPLFRFQAKKAENLESAVRAKSCKRENLCESLYLPNKQGDNREHQSYFCTLD